MSLNSVVLFAYYSHVDYRPLKIITSLAVVPTIAEVPVS